MIRPVESRPYDHRITELAIVGVIITIGLIYIAVVLKNRKSPHELYLESKQAPIKERIKLLKRAARLDEPNAKIELAKIYHLGVGVKQKLYKAKAWLKDSTEARSYFIRGEIYKEEGANLEALKMFVIASIKKYPPAYLQAGRSFLNGPVVNPSVALNYFEKGSVLLDAECMIEQANLLLQAKGCPLTVDNLKKGLQLYREAAKLNSLAACLQLAKLFLKGFAEHLDEDEVRERLEYAADQSNKKAILLLGLQKLRGSPLYLKNPREGIHWLKKISDKEIAIQTIAEHYLKSGKTIKAKEWFLKGAALNSSECLYQLYLIEKIPEWLDRAAEKEHPTALLIKAKILLKSDPELATKMLIKCMELGNMEAFHIYGMILSNKPANTSETMKKVILCLTASAPQFPKSFFYLYNFLKFSNEDELAMEALIAGAEACDLDCMKTLFHHKKVHCEVEKQEDEKDSEIANLLARIRVREPDFMRIEDDVEVKDNWAS